MDYITVCEQLTLVQLQILLPYESLRLVQFRTLDKASCDIQSLTNFRCRILELILN